MNPEYNKALKRAAYYRKTGREKWPDLSADERKERSRKLKELETRQRQITPALPLDEAFKKIQYARYADDFIIDVIGSRKDAKQVKSDVGRFLKENCI